MSPETLDPNLRNRILAEGGSIRDPDPPPIAGVMRRGRIRRARRLGSVTLITAVVLGGLGWGIGSLAGLQPTHSNTTTGSPPPCAGEPPSRVLHLNTERHSERFIPTCLVAPAGQSFTIVFTNRVAPTQVGPALPNNVSIYVSRDAGVSVVRGASDKNPNCRTCIIGYQSHPENAIFAGSTVWRQGTVHYRVPPLAAGMYWFQSDFGAWTMHGLLVVSP